MKKIFLLAALIFLLLSLGSFAADSNWFMAQTEKASVKSVVATSELVEAQFDGKYLYPPINILDGNFNTTWCEADENGSGIGEEITVEFEEPVSFDEIQIVNGFASRDYYKKNNRVKSILLTQTARTHFQQKEYTLEDGKPDWQSIRFALPQTAQTLTIKITAVYRGNKYDDTCLDSIRLLYKGKVIPFKNVENLKKIQEANSRKMLAESDVNAFKKKFFALFDGSERLFLKDKDGDGFMEVRRYGDDDVGFWSDYIKSAKILPVKDTKKEMEALLKVELPEMYKAYSENDESYESFPIQKLFRWWNDIKQNKAEYVVVGWSGPNWNREEYSLGNHRLLTTTYIDYVETTTATILDIEGNTVFVNGEPYTAISGNRVYDARYYDGP